MATGLIGRPTFGGLASGLDTNALLSGLLELERQPLQRIQSRRAEVANQRSLMRDLNSRLVKLREAAQALDNRNATGSAFSTSEEFLKYTGASSNEDVVTVSAGTGAAPGEVQVEILQLATGARRFSESYANTDDVVLTAGQSLVISLDDADPDAVPAVEQTEINLVAETNLTLADLRDQINTNEGNGGKIRADVLRIADGDNRLVITTTGTGTSNEITLSGDMTFAAQADNDRAQNSQIRLFGSEQTIERESNTINDVLTGITFELNRVSETEDDGVTNILETVTLGVDNDEIAASLEEFTKAYNDVVNFIDNQFRYNESSNSAGPLAGDFTLRQVQSELRDMVSQGFSFSTNPSNPFAPSAGNSLGGAITNIGIKIESGGTLSVDREKLDEALALDPISVREFLSGRNRAEDDPDPNDPDGLDFFDEGFASLFSTQLEQLVRSGDGTLAERDNAYDRRLREFDDSISRFESRLAQREESLILRFSELERVVAGLQNQQGFLSSITV